MMGFGTATLSVVCENPVDGLADALFQCDAVDRVVGEDRVGPIVVTYVVGGNTGIPGAIRMLGDDLEAVANETGYGERSMTIVAHWEPK